ncbi:MAG: 3-phosphoglycerate dehydrogenase [Phycisphaerae bacterium]|nr:3-phosphoglycerate dehydrogenase [Phycisphaerae bacterium]
MMTETQKRPRLLWCWPEVWEEVEELRTLLSSFADVDVRNPDRTELRNIIREYDILVPRLSHEVDAEILDAAEKLKIIGTPSTGSDHIAVAEAQRRGIPTITLKNDTAFLDSVQSTAELAWLLILACSRRMREALEQTRRGEWNSQAVRGHELIDRTIGIIGYGRLGVMISRFARAFRMKVLATDPNVQIADSWVTQVSLNELLAQADIVTLHVHLTDETRGMIGRDEFARMKPGAILANTSRGALVDEAALLDALKSGRLAAAGLDVIEGERDENRKNSPLIRHAGEHPNLIVTPHLGGCTKEAQAKAFLRSAELLRDGWEKISDS